MERWIRIYGASDDLVEVHGDITEEVGSWDRATYVKVSDGTLVCLKYSPDKSACWRITVLTKGTAFVRHAEADETQEDGKQSEVGHSDFVELRGAIWWVAFTHEDPRDVTMASIPNECPRMPPRPWDLIAWKDKLGRQKVERTG